MPRSLYSTTAALVVLATMHVTAQQPAGAASAPRSIVARAAPSPAASPRILPGTSPNVFSVIQGNALNSKNGVVAVAPVRLRDARFGQIVETQMTDRAGLFAFRKVAPGSYIVEIMGQDQYSVLAASQILNVGPGEVVSAVVKLPFGTLPLGNILGGSAPSAGAVASQAAAAGILGTQVAGAPTCDGLQQ